MFYTLVVCEEREVMRMKGCDFLFLWQVFNNTVGGVAFKCGIPVKTLLSADGGGLS